MGRYGNVRTHKDKWGTLSITENLYLALQYLRLRDTDRILWVDAICIDQSNKKEQRHQVQQMGNTYSQADRVIL